MSDGKPLHLIRDGKLIVDEWLVADGVSPAPTGVPTLLPLAIWLEQRAELLAEKSANGKPLGVWLAPTDEPSVLADDLAALDLVAVHFPKFADGRGYSTASLLRQRYGYTGELRAFGDVGRDQLFYLARVGFDSFLISEGRDAAAALNAFNDFPEVYQSANDQSLPLFRRRAA
ncbi:MAG: DUF934 domain-containing protein [Rhodocyclaceae bacterium]|nr:DUF934 domain-containing protein [Rhodocyclaceae bacterium]